MNKLYGSFAAKLIAVILLCVMALAFVGSAIAAAVVYDKEGYTGSFEAVRDAYISNLGERMLNQVGNAYVEGRLTEQNLHNEIYTGRDAFWFELRDGKNQVLLSNYEGGETCWSGIQTFEPRYNLQTMSEGDTPEEIGEIEGEGPEVTCTPKPVETTIVWELLDYRELKKYSFSSEE